MRYTFVNGKGERRDFEFPIGRRPEIVEEDGVVWLFDFKATLSDSVECNGRKGGATYSRPEESDACGINVSQIPEAMRRFPHHDYNPKTGAMRFKSASHRRQCLRDIGHVDRN